MARPVRIQHHLLFVAFAAVVCSQLVLNVAAAKERWESGKNSFEDPEYDPEATSGEDQSEEPPERLVVCEADEKPRISCTCDKTSPVTLKCGGAKLETARLYVAEDFGVALQVAHLERNEITSLSKNRILPGQEKSLQTLDLAHNKIDAIQPGAFDPFASLLELKLSHNRLDELSDDIFTPQMGSLRQLYLDHNFISKLDDGVFDNLNSLTKLVLDGNARIKLSNKVFTSALAKLEVLSLDHCHLDDTLDAELFVNLLNLRALSLSGNNLNSVPLAVGPAKLPALQVLAMSDTYLHSLENTALAERVPKLQKLYMRRMKYLEKIDDCAFCKLPSLEVLDFSDSPKLAQIDANAFGTTLPASLRQLNFKNCNISSLVEGLLPNSYFGTLKALRLGGNPWNCGCQLKWLLDNDRAIRLASEFEEPTCTAPESLKGISFYKAHDHLEKTCGPPSDGASPMGMFVVLLVSMVLAASLLVFGVFYARRRFQLAGFGEGGSGNFRVPEFLGGGSFQRASFSAGRNIFDDELEDVGDQHEEETGGHHDAAVAAGQRPRAEFV